MLDEERKRKEEKKEVMNQKERDAVYGSMTQVADPPLSPRRAADKQKYYTQGYQKKKRKLLVDFSTVSKGTSGNTKSRGAVKQVLFNQAPEKTDMQEERGGAGDCQALVVLLEKTLETFPIPAELSWRWGEGGSADVLEKSWTEIVHSHKSMSKTNRHQQEALWEFLHTELVYINKLTIINDLVLAALEYLHQWGFLHEVTSAQLFSNLPSILLAHRLFWHEVMYPMLRYVRLTGQPFDPLRLELGCLQFADRFSAYLEYCWEEKTNVEFTRTQMETNPLFNAFIRWVETHPHCGRMRVGDMQAKPHQRITKYPLLLKAIMKCTQDHHTQLTLNRMLNSVAKFLASINDYMQFKYDELALSLLSQKIEGYRLEGMSEEIDKHMQQFCHFDLTSPIREGGPNVVRKLLLGETLKVKGRKDSKLEVIVLLFSDVLLLTKTQKKSGKQKVIRPPLSLERIRCAELKDGYSFVLVEVSDLGCPVSVYSVSAPSPESCTAWISTIHQAQEALEVLRRKDVNKPEEAGDQLEFPSEENEEQSEFESSTDQQEEEDLHSQLIHELLLNKHMKSRANEINKEATPDTEGNVEHGENGQWEDDDDLNGRAVERRVTWNHVPQSRKNSSDISQTNSSETKLNAPPRLLDGRSSKPLLSSGYVPVESAISYTQHHSQRSPVTDLWQDPRLRHSSDEHESLTESFTFTRTVNSPRLRRKRPIGSQPTGLPQDSRRMSEENGSALSLNSRSFSTPDISHNHRRSSNTSIKSQDSHLVLKLGSIKQNRGAFWNDDIERLSQDLQILYESKTHPKTYEQDSQKLPIIKSQRSGSIPGKPGNLSLHPTPSSSNGPDPGLPLSPLHGILMRAKERERDRGLAKKDEKPIQISSSLQTPAAACTSPSALPSEGEDLELYGPHWKSFFQKLAESSVDDTEIDTDNVNSIVYGANVDWPGWCFDDEEALEFSENDDRSELKQTHTDEEYSEV